MVTGLQEVVLRFEFYQNRLSGFGDVRGVKICPLIWPNQWERANFEFRPPRLRKHLTDFDEIQTS